MRWFVEVSPLGKSEAPSERHCVEAAQWQKALSQVRKHAGHDEALRNFSIEVLDDGVRAVDPTVRLRYLMRRAPAGVAVTLGDGAGEPAPTTERPLRSAPPPPISTPAPAPAPSGRRSFAQTMAFGSAAPASFQQTLASAQKPEASPPSPAPVVEAPPPPPKVVQSAPPPPAPIASAPQPAPAKVAQSTPPPPLVPPDVAPSAPPPSGLPQYRVLMQRAQEPTAASPITYREMAFALLHGADEAAAETFIRSRFDDVRAQLAAAPPGKLVNLAVFDHVFDKKPQRPPVVTLVWKDWKNPEPELRFPSRPGSTMPPPSLGHPSQPSPSEPSFASMPPVPSQAVAPSFPVSQKAPVHADVPTPASTPIALRRESSQPPTTARFGSAPPPSMSAEPSHAPVASAPVPSAAAAPKPAPSPASRQPRVRKPTPAGAVDIVADLFEVMHDLHFLLDVYEGADFVMALALEKLQSQYALVQLYDINRREFVIARAAGPNAAGTVSGRTSERDPLLTEIMHRKVPFVIDPASDPRIRVGRWAALGAEPALVLAAAVAQGGRFLGAIEVGCAPGRTYVKQHLDGMAYIADAFSEFLATRGIVFSDEPTQGR